LITYRRQADQVEIVTIDSLVEKQGIGTALIEAVRQAARAAGCTRLWLITTNDNLTALGFYQKRGFVLFRYIAGQSTPCPDRSNRRYRSWPSTVSLFGMRSSWK
jgi:ribosomal protein S18 acetylase RimI-like enzyme